MTGKINRFHGSRDVRLVMRQGRAGYGRDLAVRLLKPGQARTAVVVSKKVQKNATRRNRIRRRISAAFREIRQAENLHDDAVVVVKSADLADLDYQKLKQQLQTAIGRRR